MERQRSYKDENAITKVGAKIREIRLKKGLSQQKLADLCNIELSQINRIELGKVNTSVSHIFLIAEKLDVSPTDLVNVE